jgi:pilus assembly protein CpaE
MIPNSYVCVSASVNQGVPVINISKNNPVTNALCDVVKKIDVGPIVKKEGWLLSLLNRL